LPEPAALAENKGQRGTLENIERPTRKRVNRPPFVLSEILMVATDRLDITKTYKLYINGLFPRSESGRSIAVTDSAGKVIAHISHGSRKDLRDAVEAAAAAQPRWAAATAYNRGQVLYRMAEMLEGKKSEFIAALREQKSKTQNPKSKAGARANSRPQKGTAALDPLGEVEASIDRLIAFAGWADKFAQVLGCNNPVSGPYYNFTIPEPTGVVGIVTPPPPAPALLAMITLLAPVMCSGNAAVVIADETAMIPAAIFGEVCGTSDVPAGVINILTSLRSELLDHLARHRNVNAISAANLPREQSTVLKAGLAENVKRVHVAKIDNDQGWLDPDRCEGPWTIEPFIDFKTIWHPAAV
jgi:acyl-CoA reductase-like NAD-dependent aldehyde dehydrogenase